MLFKRVWLSMSSVYREGTDCLALLLLSSRLWSQLTNVNVAVQVYNNTPVSSKDSPMIDMMRDSGVLVMYDQHTPGSSVCDEALEARLSSRFLHSKLTK